MNFLLQKPKKDLVSTAATGSGKTYTFFLPSLFEEERNGVTFGIVPLKKLGDQHRDSAIQLGLTAISLEAKMIDKEVVKVHNSYISDDSSFYQIGD